MSRLDEALTSVVVRMQKIAKCIRPNNGEHEYEPSEHMKKLREINKDFGWEAISNERKQRSRNVG